MVERALHEGAAVEDPGLAALAVEKATRDRHAMRHWHWLGIFYGMSAVGWLLLGLRSIEATTAPLYFVFAPLFGAMAVTQIAITVVQRRRLRRAEKANREVADREEVA